MESHTIYNNSENKSLDEISSMFDVSVQKLQELNPILKENVLIAVYDNPEPKVIEETLESKILYAVSQLPEDKQNAIMSIIQALQ